MNAKVRVFQTALTAGLIGFISLNSHRLSFLPDEVLGNIHSLWIVAVFVAIIGTLEILIPADRSSGHSKVGGDWGYFFLENLGITAIATGFALSPAGALYELLPSYDFGGSAQRTGIPVAVVYIAQLILFDGIDTLRHRAEHTLGFLWDYHSVHHSQTHMSYRSFDRNHLVSLIYNGFIYGLVGHILALDPFEQFALLVAVNFNEYLTHANLRLSYGPLLGKVIVSPLYHRTHHAALRDFDRAPYGCNFANLFPIWDLLMGTARFDYAFTTGNAGEKPDEAGGNYLAHQINGFKRSGRRLAGLFHNGRNSYARKSL